MPGSVFPGVRGASCCSTWRQAGILMLSDSTLCGMNTPSWFVCSTVNGHLGVFG